MTTNNPSARFFYNLKTVITADLTKEQAGSFSSCLDEIALSTAVNVPERGQYDWTFAWLFGEKPDGALLDLCLSQMNANLPEGLSPLTEAGLDLEEIEDRNWLEHSYKQFPPFSIGHFFIHGEHYEGEVPQGETGLQISAVNAFGSGEHGTTEGCLRALIDLKEQKAAPPQILDLGTGSGILAIAAAKLWPEAGITATDIEEDSVYVAQHHCTINKTPDIRCFQADGFAAPEFEQQNSFDLVIANILAATLDILVGDIAAATKPQGYIILSGILDEQAARIKAAYGDAGYMLIKEYPVGEWATLVMRKNA